MDMEYSIIISTEYSLRSGVWEILKYWRFDNSLFWLVKKTLSPLFPCSLQTIAGLNAVLFFVLILNTKIGLLQTFQFLSKSVTRFHQFGQDQTHTSELKIFKSFATDFKDCVSAVIPRLFGIQKSLEDTDFCGCFSTFFYAFLRVCMSWAKTNMSVLEVMKTNAIPDPSEYSYLLQGIVGGRFQKERKPLCFHWKQVRAKRGWVWGQNKVVWASFRNFYEFTLQSTILIIILNLISIKHLTHNQATYSAKHW